MCLGLLQNRFGTEIFNPKNEQDSQGGGHVNPRIQKGGCESQDSQGGDVNPGIHKGGM